MKTIKVRISKPEMELLNQIKGESTVNDFIGFLIRRYANDELYESAKLEPEEYNTLGIEGIVQQTLNRMYEKIEKNNILKNAQAITESIGEIKLNNNVHQIQLRVQKDQSCFIHPHSHELSKSGGFVEA